MSRPHAYCDYNPPCPPWQWVWMRASQWRTRFSEWRKRGDGLDYTGWEARVVSLPAPSTGVSVGTIGRVVRVKTWGLTGRCTTSSLRARRG